MDFILKQTLENVSLMKIATLLWNHHEIRVLVAEFTHSIIFSCLDDDVIFFPDRNFRREKWQEIEDKVIDKTTKLTIPITLKEKFFGYIEAVGVQILKWMEYHLKYCRLDLDLPKEICWTTQATIDKKKTAEALVKDASIDIITRYKLACIYCLEDYILGLFNEIPEKQKKFYYSEKNPMKILQKELVVFWGYYIKREVYKIDDIIRRKYNHRCFYACMFRSAAESGNKVATEYFYQKLNPTEKTSININTALSVVKIRPNSFPKITDPPKEYYTEVLCFLLSQLNKEHQIEVFKTYPCGVLRCFLDWPWQSFFVEIVSHVQNFLQGSLSKYHVIFLTIIYKMFLDCKDYNYKRIFIYVWQQISDADKRFIINNSMFTSMLNMLLLVKDKENFRLVRLIFRDATVIDKNKLIFSYGGRCICKSLIDRDKWDLLKLFVQLLISSKEEMIKFKEEFENSFQTERKLPIDQYKKLFCVLDDFVCEYDKRRNVNEAETSSAKRFCNVEFKDMTQSVKK